MRNILVTIVSTAVVLLIMSGISYAAVVLTPTAITAGGSLQLNGATSGNLTLKTATTTTSYSIPFPSTQASADEFLRNNSGTVSWEPASTATLGGVGDVTLTSIATDEVLQWDSAAWVNKNLSAIGLLEAHFSGLSSYVTPSSTDAFTNKTFNANATGNVLSNVDVSDLSIGTDGELITWDASGNPAVVAAGTANQVLKSNGAGAAPTFQNPNAWEHIDTQILTGTATKITFSSIDTAYRKFRLHIYYIKPSSNNQRIRVWLNNDSGSNYTMQRIRADNTTISSERLTNLWEWPRGLPIDESSSGLVVITISKPVASEVARQTSQFAGMDNVGGGTPVIIYDTETGEWSNTDDLISQIDVESAVTGFDIGTRVVLEGIKP